MQLLTVLAQPLSGLVLALVEMPACIAHRQCIPTHQPLPQVLEAQITIPGGSSIVE